MPHFRSVHPGALYLLMLLACGQSPGERDRAALELVVRMHRELFKAQQRQVLNLNQGPQAALARSTSLWTQSELADPDCLALSKSLLTSYRALWDSPRDGKLAVRVRDYCGQRALAAQQQLTLLEQANSQDAVPGQILLRQALMSLLRQDHEIALRYQASAERLQHPAR